MPKGLQNLSADSSVEDTCSWASNEYSKGRGVFTLAGFKVFPTEDGKD